MAWKKASVELLCNYARYFGFEPVPEQLENLKWAGYQILISIAAPARRRDGENEEDQLKRSFRRRTWAGDGDNLQSERAKRARERGR